MMYRVTFHNGPNGNLHQAIDIHAESSQEASTFAIRHFGERKLRESGFLSYTVERIEEGPKVIGLEIECKDTYFMSVFHDYIFIRAMNEAQAVRYYNDHLKGGRFNFNANDDKPNGKCVRGRVVETYFAAALTAPWDATGGN